MMKGVLNGLASVHEAEYIHRDIKPDNILFVSRDNISSSKVQLVDFGLSARFSTDPKFEIDDKIGTLLFMAPEQISL